MVEIVGGHSGVIDGYRDRMKPVEGRVYLDPKDPTT